MLGPTRTIRVFLSSTFSDLADERDALQNQVFPSLDAHCRRLNARFQAIDLRWGVSSEDSRSQQTMRICLEELRRCKEVSPGLNLVILLGERYGWRPAPTPIERYEFDAITAVMGDADRNLVRSCYQLDCNSIPTAYLLRPRNELQALVQQQGQQDPEAFLRVLMQHAAREVLRGWPDGHARLGKYEQSATHQEIVQGEVGNAEQRSVFVFLREFQYWGVTLEAHIAEAHTDLDCLHAAIQDLRQQVPGDQIISIPALWTGQGTNGQHIGLLCERVEEALKAAIDQYLERTRELTPSEQEDRSHRAYARELARQTVPFPDYEDRILEFLESDLASASALTVVGPPGSGRSTLLGRVVTSRLTTADPAEHVVVRFVGLTADSLSSSALAVSMAEELERLAGAPAAIERDPKALLRAQVTPAQRLATALARASGRHRLVIVIDGIDQVRDWSQNDEGLGAWLFNDPPPSVKFIISAGLPRGGSPTGGKLYRNRGRVLHLPAHLFTDAAMSLLDRLLREQGRQVLGEQRSCVQQSFERQSPSVLFIRLCAHRLRWLRSFDPVPAIGPDEADEFRNLLRDLQQETRHRALPMGRMAGYLALTRFGLGEEELLEVLASDAEFMDDFRAHSAWEVERHQRGLPPTAKVPQSVWSRVFHDLQPYVSNRRLNELQTLSFAQPLFSEVVQDVYLASPLRAELHGRLYEHYSKLAGQPHPGAPALRRRWMVESLYHLLHSQDYKRLHEVLRSPETYLPVINGDADQARPSRDWMDHVLPVIERFLSERHGQRWYIFPISSAGGLPQPVDLVCVGPYGVVPIALWDTRDFEESARPGSALHLDNNALSGFVQSEFMELQALRARLEQRLGAQSLPPFRLMPSVVLVRCARLDKTVRLLNRWNAFGIPLITLNRWSRIFRPSEVEPMDSQEVELLAQRFRNSYRPGDPL